MNGRELAMADLGALDAAVRTSGLAAIVAATPENVRLAGNLEISTQRNIRHRPAYVLWPARAEPVFVVAENEAARVRLGSWIRGTSCYRESVVSPMEALARAIADGGLAAARIGLELDFMPWSFVEELRARLPQLQVERCDDLWRQVRMRKSSAERDALATAARGTEAAIARTFAACRIGMDEVAMHRRACAELMACGAQRIHSVHVYGGPNAAGPHMGPTSRRLQRGDLVKADLCGVFASYISNVGRTAVVGEPCADDVQAWAAFHAIHRAVVAAIRPGVRGSEVHALARELYARAGLELRHPNNGHSIGLEVHEAPQVGPAEQQPYEPGMVTTVETRARLADGRAFHVEDMLRVDDAGPYPLTDLQANASLLVIPADPT